MVIEPIDGLDIAIDYFDIEVDNVIAVLGGLLAWYLYVRRPDIPPRVAEVNAPLYAFTSAWRRPFSPRFIRGGSSS